MTKIQFLLSVTLFAVPLVPALVTEQFERPPPSNLTRHKLEEINGLLSTTSMQWAISGQLTATIDTLRRKACQRASDYRPHILSALYRPMVAREVAYCTSGKNRTCSALLRSGHNSWSIASKVDWTLSSMCCSRSISSTPSTSLRKQGSLTLPDRDGNRQCTPAAEPTAPRRAARVLVGLLSAMLRSALVRCTRRRYRSSALPRHDRGRLSMDVPAALMGAARSFRSNECLDLDQGLAGAARRTVVAVTNSGSGDHATHRQSLCSCEDQII